MADRQVSIQTQALLGWEHALKLSTEANVEQLFKTVSKTAVQNLSPSKCRADVFTPTETDFDDIDNYSGSDLEFRLDQDKNDIKEQTVSRQGTDDFGHGNDNKLHENDIGVEVNDILIHETDSASKVGVNNQNTEVLSPILDSSRQENDIKTQGSNVIVQGVEIEYQNGDNNSNTENSVDKSLLEHKSRSDPLHDFSEVDLSS